MKKLPTLFAFLLITLSSNAQITQNSSFGDLNKDGKANVTDVMMLVNAILDGPKELALSAGNIILNIGNTSSVNVTSGYGKYTAVCSDESIAEVSLEGSVITITGKAEGTVVVTVTDQITDSSMIISVTVTDAITSYLTCPDDHHPHIIDLGLPSGTKWACCNVDSDPLKQSPLNYGGYYSWGETEEKITYYWDNYVHCKGSCSTCYDLGSNIIGTSYDVAYMKWGDLWQMPSFEQIKELLKNCISKWVTINNINGCMFTGQNGNNIFLPAAGFHEHNTPDFCGSCGSYWSGTQDNIDAMDAFCLDISARYINWNEGNRNYGYTVRPVANEATISPLQLSASTLSLSEGVEGMVEITSGNGNYSVESSDESVATATIQNNAIKVTAVTAGTATITVTDTKSHQTATITVAVTAAQTSYLTCPDNHHPHMIDLGLPSGTKWACCNVDTEHPENQKPENYGGYYAWGDTEEKSVYDWDNYGYEFIGNDPISGTMSDVAHVMWGSEWYMPSFEQLQELYNKCTHEREVLNHVVGYRFTGSNGGSIFLPAAGCYLGSKLYEFDEGCHYWSGTPYYECDDCETDDTQANCLTVIDGGYVDVLFTYRSAGFSVRPVITYDAPVE